MTPFAKPVFLITPEEAATDEACGMKLWYSKYQNGGGIMARDKVLPQEMLEATLADMRLLATLPDISQNAIQAMINEVLEGIPRDQINNLRAMELLYRRLGWLAAYALYVEPQVRKIYDNIALPEEVDLERSPLVVRMKMGRLLRHKHNYQVEHRAFMPAVAGTERWRSRWEWDILPQLHLLAAREAQEHRVDSARITGLNMGVTSSVANGQLHHPYVYASFNKETGEWTNTWKSQDDAQWVQRPIWEAPFSITTWVLKCGSSVVENQFPLSPKIPCNQTMAQRWFDRRLYRERHVQSIKQHCHKSHGLRNIHFPVVTAQCAPLHAPHCDFKDLCWSETFMRDALLKTHFTINLPVLLTQPDPPGLGPERKTLSQLVEETMDEAQLQEERDQAEAAAACSTRVTTAMNTKEIIDLSPTHSAAQLSPAHAAFIPTALEMFPGVI